MEKKTLEELVGVKMSDDVFGKVMEATAKKQNHLIKLGDPYAHEDWYFEELAVEQFRARCFTDFTISVCMASVEMEKEHSENRSALNS
ncbi:MAG: hypothetical protein IJ053_04645 [Lachnospiraceae bacterium]|nr:hypothetical protein [Lachnospiraceae bacterium]